MLKRWLLVAVVLGSVARAQADERSDREARALFLEGKNEYEHERYEEALRLFSEAFGLSARPALLFNMAACLRQLGRPHDAAKKLRTYLDLVPREPEREAIERDMRELEAAPEERHNEQPNQGGAGAGSAAYEERIRQLEERLDASESAPRRRSRRGLAIGMGVAGGLLVLGGAVTVGVVLANRGPDYTPSTVGTLQATP